MSPLTHTNHGAIIPLPERIVHHYTCALMEKVPYHTVRGRAFLAIDPYELMTKNCTCGAEKRAHEA